MKSKLELQIDLGLAYYELERAKDIIKELWPLRQQIRDLEEKYDAQMVGRYSVMMILRDERDKVDKENNKLKENQLKLTNKFDKLTKLIYKLEIKNQS